MALRDVFIDELRDLYSAENQLTKALPKMAKGSDDPSLKQLFEAHLKETQGHVDRLKQAFQQLGEKPTGETCKGMEGLIKEGSEQLESDEDATNKDVCITGAALRVEHYEIAGYTAAISIGKALGEREIVSLLEETLAEEESAAKKVLKASTSLISEAKKAA